MSLAAKTPYPVSDTTAVSFMGPAAQANVVGLQGDLLTFRMAVAVAVAAFSSHLSGSGGDAFFAREDWEEDF